MFGESVFDFGAFDQGVDKTQWKISTIKFVNVIIIIIKRIISPRVCHSHVDHAISAVFYTLTLASVPMVYWLASDLKTKIVQITCKDWLTVMSLG